jgi:hypothetical protein
MPRSSLTRSSLTAAAIIQVAVSSDARHHCLGQNFK